VKNHRRKRGRRTENTSIVGVRGPDAKREKRKKILLEVGEGSSVSLPEKTSGDHACGMGKQQNQGGKRIGLRTRATKLWANGAVAWSGGKEKVRFRAFR